LEKTYTPQHLRRWREQVNYQGDNFDDYYVAIWRFFRCTPLERSNFRYVKDHLNDSGAAAGAVILPSFTDEVMMCRYYVMVHQDATRALKMADMFAERIKRKGSLDPDGERQLNWDAIVKIWHLMATPGRIQLCREANVSIFAARRQDPTHESLIELLSEAS
jgi:hypothetical protein